MPSQEQQLRNLARIARYQTLRNWALLLGFIALVMVGVVAGLGGGNPEVATSIFAVFALAGYLHWTIAWLVAIGLGLLIIGAFLHGLTKRTHGEV